ncbi:MAG: SCO family protein [Bacteroidia bacterium]
MPKYLIFTILFLLAFASCSDDKLPILGNTATEKKIENGKEIEETIYQTIPDFEFLNQDSIPVNKKSVQGKVYVADFFFITCPTICPIMKKNLIKVYEKFGNNSNFTILSHTIDPEHDTIALLKDYSERIGSNGKNWQFLWGNREDIYKIAEEGYFVSAMADSTAPGGFVHSGGLILVDPMFRVRGIYDGTNDKEVEKLIKDIPKLLREFKL